MMKKKKILIVGGGGREHVIAWKLSQSPRVGEILCVPGNAGIAQIARCADTDAEDTEAVTALAAREAPDLVVIGPEVPLAKGLTDRIEALGIPVFGPNERCARLEASKSFTKRFLARHGIPTAGYLEFTDREELRSKIGVFGYPMVLKADGLAAGKGVVIAQNAEEAERAVRDMMDDRVFGAAGDKIVVEEYLRGVEASVLCFVDGSAIVPMESAQDYKRIFDRDEGPNTGGMGTYSPSLVFDETLEKQIADRILNPTFAGFRADGLDFKGVLFIGLMITDEGPKVIEFNNRFGDPEAQSVLRRLDTDLLDIFEAVTEDRLAGREIVWNDARAVCVVMASGGYPGAYEKGKAISGLDDTDEGIVVFHAGTKFGPNGEFLTAGGRVLSVTAVGKTHDEAREKAYNNVKKISFEKAQYRTDIGIVYHDRA
ncbi:MAG: phosphoribosylamine--glycine ligase [Clostridiales Family XIII bacterium]|jgi:phosphoribosylamine--glycine ligase|nr:phosphoribosylamine--glycine ligase [Clostridiales Family XIII bacterium]